MQWQQWTVIDALFVIILLVSIVLALRKGLARELISLVALFGGFFLASFHYPAVAGWFAGFTRTRAIADLIGFLAIFLACLLLGAVASYLVNRFIKMASLQWADRVLGAVFGLLRGWAISSVIALAVIAFPVHPEGMARSVLAPFLLAGARAAVLMVPQELKLKFDAEYRKIVQSWNQNRSGS